jgi:hypothetical protein
MGFNSGFKALTKVILRGMVSHSTKTEKKARKNLSQGSEKLPVGTMRRESTEQNVHNNKNT